MPISSDKTVEELLSLYARKIGVLPEELNNKLIFLYKACSLYPYSKDKLNELFKDNDITTVLDIVRIIGA